MSHIPHLGSVAVSLALACAGFFAVHASAVGSMNRRLSSSRGRANSLYILWYYGRIDRDHGHRALLQAVRMGAGSRARAGVLAALLVVGVYELREAGQAKPTEER